VTMGEAETTISLLSLVRGGAVSLNFGLGGSPVSIAKKGNWTFNLRSDPAGHHPKRALGGDRAAAYPSD